MRRLVLMAALLAAARTAAAGPALDSLHLAADGQTEAAYSNGRPGTYVSMFGGPVRVLPPVAAPAPVPAKSRWPTCEKVNAAMMSHPLRDPMTVGPAAGIVVGGAMWGPVGAIAGLIGGVFAGIAVGLLILGTAALIDLVKR